MKSKVFLSNSRSRIWASEKHHLHAEMSIWFRCVQFGQQVSRSFLDCSFGYRHLHSFRICPLGGKYLPRIGYNLLLFVTGFTSPVPGIDPYRKV